MVSLFATGEIEPVASASLGCLPAGLLDTEGITYDEVIDGWCNGLPTLIAITETVQGRIARIKLPRFNSELYRDPDDLLHSIVGALELAKLLGARTASLTGMIPSATDYGRAIVEKLAGRKDLPAISTGHGTTVTSVVLAIKRILDEGGRTLDEERVGFIGLGSIGQTSLRLMLSCLPHPAEITLCDVYSKQSSLEEIRRDLFSDFGYRGTVRILESRQEVPLEFYDATIIVGATNVPDILDISRVKPGTLIVDDSSPHCFRSEDAIKRFQDFRCHYGRSGQPGKDSARSEVVEAR